MSILVEILPVGVNLFNGGEGQRDRETERRAEREREGNGE
jgi:hypothetical protein